MEDIDDKDNEITIKERMEKRAEGYILNKINWFLKEVNVRSVFLDGANYGYALGCQQVVKNLNLAEQENG